MGGQREKQTVIPWRPNVCCAIRKASGDPSQASHELSDMPVQDLEFAINHVFLPPKLPQSDDTSATGEAFLLRSLLDSMREFATLQPEAASRLWPSMRMIERLLRLQTCDTKETATAKMIQDLTDGESAVFYIREQNAGLLLTATANTILAQGFELLSKNCSVMSSKGRLIRQFPDAAAEFPHALSQNQQFTTEVARVISHLTKVPMATVRPKTRKANSDHDESRDTVSPALVTGMLVAVLQGLGKAVEPATISKRMREQVNWDNTKNPFHRSPLWVLLRIAMRISLGQHSQRNEANALYKAVSTFYHAYLLEKANETSLSSDIRFTMSAKLLRRITKLYPSERPPWYQKAQKILNSDHRCLQSRWLAVQEEEQTPFRLRSLANLDFADDIKLRLHQLNSHISWIQSRPSANSLNSGPGDETTMPQTSVTQIPRLSSDPEMRPFVLLNFETWVDRHLSAWVASQLETNNKQHDRSALSVAELEGHIKTYLRLAQDLYANDPEALSVMHLITMELWVALDRIAGDAINLLFEYNPGFTSALFHPLILPTARQMERLQKIENYISARSARKTGNYFSMFSNFGQSCSFAVRYFDASLPGGHRELHDRIVSSAERNKRAKLEEYRAKHQRWSEWDAERRQTTHDKEWNEYSSRWQCKWDCKVCELDRKIKEQTISKFEWPLPTDPDEAKAVVFEIDVPAVVRAWRDTTVHIFLNVLIGKDRWDTRTLLELYYPREHSGLHDFSRSSSSIQLASSIKSVERSHYGRKEHISMCTESEVCVEHGCRYDYYHMEKGAKSNMVFQSPSIDAACSHAAHEPNAQLEKWIRRTSHMSNDVISALELCGNDMTLEEFKAFGHIRAGESIQWANILGQLTMPSLDLNRQSTFLLMMQACTEAGECDKLGSVHRKTHCDPADEPFAAKFLVALEESFVRVHKNWQNDIALGLLACLATRTLSLTQSRSVAEGLLKLLARIRATSISWARVLLTKRAKSPSNDERQALAHRALMSALICMSTFYMESNHLEPLLASPHDLSHFCEAAILACDHLPSRITDPVYRFMACRWRSLMYQSMGILRGEIVEAKNPGLGCAIQHFWADYVPPQFGWTVRHGSQSHILESSISKNGQSTWVTLNMLTGQLLVNGYPLSRLPRNFELHCSYQQLFETQVLEVMPSTLGGMQFSACRDQEGWIVHFSMVDGEAIVQAVRRKSSMTDGTTSDEDFWEFIPRNCFAGDLPQSFIMNFSHWRNMTTGNIEFRPAAAPWKTSPDHWVLTTESDRKVLKQGHNFVVDPYSTTATTIWTGLKSIESKHNLDIIFDRRADQCQLGIHLPRFALSFSLYPGESALRSKHYAGMILDGCQGIGTLMGLQNKLVLRDEDCSEGLSPARLILVPRGEPSVSSKHHHVQVEIQTTAMSHVKHEAFKVDTRLGRLIDNGSLSSKLFLSLLHALTSHCLPDPLTERTGTEEALRILQQGAVRSFQRLDMNSISILREISALSPQRVFYPKHLQNMEQIRWDPNLPVLSQHDEFRAVVEAIMAHAKDCEVLHESTEGRSQKELHSLAADVRSHHLVERAIIRNSNFRVAEFGAQDHPSHYDVDYRGRQSDDKEFKRSRIAQGISSQVDSKPPQLLFPITPSKLKSTILSTTGDDFYGNPRVDLLFNSGYFDRPSDALKGLWCGLHRSLAKEENRYRVIFFLSSLAFATEADLDLVQALLAITTHRAMFGSLVEPPDAEAFHLAFDNASLRNRVTEVVNEKCLPMKKCPAVPLSRRPHESESNFQARRYKQWETHSGAMAKALVSSLQSQWSKSWTITKPLGQSFEEWIDLDAVMPATNDILDFTRRSALFTEYLDSLVLAVEGMACLASSQHAFMTSPPGLNTVRDPGSPPNSHIGFIRDTSLFSNPAPETRRPVPERFLDLLEEIPQLDAEQRPISTLIQHLSDLGKDQQHQLSYIEELRQSSECSGVAPLKFKADDHGSFWRLSDYLNKCQRETSFISREIFTALKGNGAIETLCANVEFYPRVSPIFLLQHLRRAKWSKLSTEWKAALLNYALSLAYLQRAERLVKSHGVADRRVDFLKEIRNVGYHESEDCDPLEWPEYVLLEVEQGILIRPVQHQIAANMRSPPEGKSCVMQLNMGEGKSSVIVPIVSTSLSDGSCLGRVVVAKAQAQQMSHTLVGAIGGLLGRRTFYLPICRAVRLDDRAITTIASMIQLCREEGGVLLVQPEHILSFKLMGLEGIWNESSVAQKIMSTYSELEAISRDIVDESDENFSVKFELIYTMGSQKPVDMSPDRWVLIQNLLDFVHDTAKELKHAQGERPGLSEGLLFEQEDGTGRFPTIRTLDDSTGAQLVEAVAHKLCTLGMKGLPIQHQTTQMRRAILQYILDPSVDQRQVEMVENDRSGLFQDTAMRNGLFLLRGLLANGVLQFALGQKRFRVNYGLAPDRQPPTLLAVPYRAKDSPAPRSEFSHTDVVIILTCLSYYYRGLTDAELFISLELLMNSDRAEQEYSSWSRASPLLDPALRHVSAVNLKDKTLCTDKLFPGLRFTKSAIDYYLSNIVFPKEMREFPFKLSSSGWDLAKPKTYPLTGFSGTTDSRYVLPLSITALDLPEQRYTNSHVLACLLQSENTVEELGNDQKELCALTVDMLLSAVTESNRPTRVILDVGAQIIQLGNIQFSKHWLSLVSDADAVIFFNDNDELSVLTRDGTVESFYTSPFRTQTERCLVFLDQSHTRGTDLRLPDTYRAAVTLGPGVTKDTLVQACMRMRKLGNGQSVTFCLSPEMQKRIRDFEQMDISCPISVMHILTFAISETWDDAHRSVPLWATQGLRHQRQEEIIRRVRGYDNVKLQDVKEYLEDEAQTLEKRYRPVTGDQCQSLSSQLEKASTLVSRQAEVAAIQRKCIEFGFNNLDMVVTLEEEQERELAPEIEQERHIERPAPMKPCKHSLHPDVRHFAMTATLKPDSRVFFPAFQAMLQSSASELFPADKFPSNLLITEDFAKTVQPGRAGYCSDSYQRPVQWLLTGRISQRKQTDSLSTMTMVVISPYEADIIKSDILRCSNGAVTLHSYLPRSSLSFRTMEDLKTFTYPLMTPRQLEEWTAPPELIMQLNLFAGQLYLRSYGEYVRMCQYLGLSFTENKNDGSNRVVVGADGFVGRAGGRGYENCPFEVSPVGFLGVLYKKLRRDCANIDRTHMGIVLGGGILTEKDFEGVEGNDEKIGDSGEEESGLERLVEQSMRLDVF
ncbi:hypothetical protein QBC40DRAFT_345375 [Triangularia verruculosa]|uniref:ubiquitinyl hydrolase 1 n=1 Tax=Triangularia verruculosa TaxID=2587418 RepID=A0AAN6XQE3_9PEZI|nr:hypothetical protein QBC40DRAFT_345375 [Triangularia verruculosa]